jgi:putative transposase
MHKRKPQVGDSWKVDETSIKVGGKERYLSRAVDKNGNTLDFLFTKRRQRLFAQNFSIKPLAIMENQKW